MASNIIELGRKRSRPDFEDNKTYTAQIALDPDRAEPFIRNVFELLTCLICANIIHTTPIYQCENGHFLCPECHFRVEECPFGRCKWSTRNRLAEDLVNAYLKLSVLPCPFVHHGCSFQGTKPRFDFHLLHCEYRSISCPGDHVEVAHPWEGSVKALWAHLEEKQCCIVINVDSQVPTGFKFSFKVKRPSREYCSNLFGDLYQVFIFRGPFLDRMVPVLVIVQLENGGFAAYMRLMVQQSISPVYEISTHLKASGKEPEVRFSYRGTPYAGVMSRGQILAGSRYFHCSRGQVTKLEEQGAEISLTFIPGVTVGQPVALMEPESEPSDSESESDDDDGAPATRHAAVPRANPVPRRP